MNRPQMLKLIEAFSKKSLFLYSLVFSVFSAHAGFKDSDLETLEFTSNEVTWLAVDISPDGETFVLEVLGDLYTLPRGGGTATQLTEGVAFESQPAFSPDGEFIAFISDESGVENLWLMSPDGSDRRRLTSLGDREELASPSWSPDGSHILVSKTSWGLRTNEIWAYSTVGGKGVKLTSAGSKSTPSDDRHNALGAVYSPDSKYIYYARKFGGFGYNLTYPIWQIVRKDLQKGREDVLTNAPGSAIRPQLSPDGTLMVYGTRFNTLTGLRIRDFSGGTDEWLAYPIQHDEQESKYTRDLLPAYTFSPSGKEVFYTVDGKLFAIDVESRANTEIPFTIPIKLKHFPRKEFEYRLGMGPVRAKVIRSPEISPDGALLTFSAFAQIYTYDLQDDTLKAITEENVVSAQPTFSPNGKKIAFVTYGENGGHIWTMSTSGRGNQKQITTDAAFYSDPLWSKDGNEIIALRSMAYNREVGGWDTGAGTGGDVIKVDVKTGKSEVIRHTGLLTSPHRGPDADRIYFYESPGMFSSGTGKLVSTLEDGTDWQEHLSLTGPGIYFTDEPVPVSSIKISPVGKYVLAQHANQLYLIQLLGENLHYIKTSLESASLAISQITEIGVDEFGWSNDGKHIFWTVGHDLYQRPVDSVDFEPAVAQSKDSANQDNVSTGSEKSDQALDDSEGDNEESEDPLAEAHPAVHSKTIRVYQPRDVPSSSFVLRNAGVITVANDTPELLEQTDVLVVNDRIKMIGQDIDVGEGVESIDISGKFVVPGFVDTHAHFNLFRRVISHGAWAMQANLAYGVTTGIDVQPSTIDVLVYGDLIDTGRIVGPRVLSTGPGVFMNNDFKSERHAKSVLSRYKKHYNVNNIKSYISGNREQRQWLAVASQELELMTTTEGALDLKRDITHAIDGFAGNEHNLPVIGIFDDVSTLYGKTRIAYTPTLLVSYGGPFGLGYFVTNESPWKDEKLARFTPPHVLEQTLLRSPWAHQDEHVFEIHARQALDVVRKGGRVGVGSHGELQGLGFHWELWAIASGGFSNFEALRAATRHGAEMIGYAKDIGTIEEEKLADLVVLNRNPLEDIRHTNDIHLVIKNGVVYIGDTLEQILPDTVPLPVPYWSDHFPPSVEPN